MKLRTMPLSEILRSTLSHVGTRNLDHNQSSRLVLAPEMSDAL